MLPSVAENDTAVRRFMREARAAGLTGKLPFEAATFPALAVEIATSSPPAPRTHVPALDARLDDVVMRAIAREPSDRFDDVAALGRALEPFGSIHFDPRRGSPPMEVASRRGADRGGTPERTGGIRTGGVSVDEL